MKKLFFIIIAMLILSVISCSGSQALAPEDDTLYSLTLLAEEGGTIAAGLADTVSGDYKAGERILLPPVRSHPPEYGYTFDGWISTNGGRFEYVSNQTYFIMPANDVTVIATFKKL